MFRALVHGFFPDFLRALMCRLYGIVLFFQQTFTVLNLLFQTLTNSGSSVTLVYISNKMSQQVNLQSQ